MGNLLGGSTGSGSSGGGNVQAGSTSSSTTNVPWAGQQPYLTDIYQKGQNIGNTPLSYYPGQTYASPTSQQNQAIDLQTQRALAGSPVNKDAQANATSTLNGDYLSSGNPYFQGMVGQLGDALRPQIDSNSEAAGRYGSGSNDHAFADALSKEAGTLAYGNYAQERQNQLGAMSMAPNLANTDYTDIGNLATAGAQQQAFNQLPITQAVNAYNFNQDAPYLQANRYAGLVGGAIPGGGTSATSYYTAPPNSTAQGLSLAGSGMNMLGKGG